MSKSLPTKLKRPFRGEINYCFAARDMDDAARIDDLIHRLIEAVTGLPSEGGAMGVMDRDDVVPASPLDLLLNEEKAA